MRPTASKIAEGADHAVNLKVLDGLVAALLIVVPSHADGATAIEPGTLAVGSTGIFCYKAPCPWRGIIGPEDGERPLWTGDSLPALQAGAEDRERIGRAWDDFECVLVDGEFDGMTLTVNQVIECCS